MITQEHAGSTFYTKKSSYLDSAAITKEGVLKDRAWEKIADKVGVALSAKKEKRARQQTHVARVSKGDFADS
jgi:hypothetical protein